MLNLNHLTLRRGNKLLFNDVSLTIHAGQKVGITGANGSGKSSLFGLIRGAVQADGGELSLPGNLVIAHVEQEMPAVDDSALDYVLQGDDEYFSLQGKIATAQAGGDTEHLAEWHERMNQINGYAAPARAARLLDGLGFSQDQLQQAVRAFSGGWRMRLNLARALMCRSDILLLDEPTNHLDLDAVIWLQDWLRVYPGTLLLISHDRDFLDEVASQIAHVAQQDIILYSGNYSEFERQRAEKLAQQQAAFDKQRREIDHVRQFVNRFRAKATKAKQVQSRIKALERMEAIAPAHVDSPFRFRFLPPEKMPFPLVSLEQGRLGYDETTILREVGFSLLPGERIALLGANGAGKSTLIKLLAGEMQPLSGKMERARDLNIGYFAQHQLERLNPDKSPLQHLLELDPKASEQSMRDFLGGFGFHGDKVLDVVAPFSGGEKARLVLALIVYQRPNLLLLDEPTNHLDIEMRHALSLALQDYEGAMVVVSHDRHLMRTISDELWLVSDGRLEAFKGDLDEYRDWLLNKKRAAEISARPAGESAGQSKKEKRQQQAQQRKQLQPLRNQVKRLEQRLEELNSKRQEMETLLADNTLYESSNKDRLTQLLGEKGNLDQELHAVEEEWLERQDELEQAEANIGKGEES
ncbi:MAG: ATP-binding cassette domain-containing protein [Gammaproteobacteria bacterium]|nr:ATP-binding cassette domain-containing protein [Gammaproteobacteria bacterium]